MLGSLVACAPTYAPMHVTVETGAAPQLLAVRDATSTGWRGVATAGTTAFDLVVSGPYEVVVRCAPRFEGVESVTVYARSPSDPPLLDASCAAPVPPSLTVSGTLVEPGQIALGHTGDFSENPDWSFALQLAPGTYDLVLFQDESFSTPEQIALRRDLKLTGDLDLGTLDVAQEPGHAVVETRFAAPSLLPGEQLSPSLELRTATTTAFLPASLELPLGKDVPDAWRVPLVPDAALRPTDRQTVSLAALSTSTIDGIIHGSLRLAARDIRVGDTAGLTLPEPLAPIAFDMARHRITAAWSSLGNYTDVLLTYLSQGSGNLPGRGYALLLSRNYIEDVGMAGATLDLTGVPGLSEDWQIDPARWALRELDVIQGDLDDPRAAWGVLEAPMLQPVTVPRRGTMIRWSSPVHRML
ncbi:MAG TPA: hypothetical protein VF516_20385 [Kofleriaceae bacterium]